jgi:hypothetical protein
MAQFLREIGKTAHRPHNIKSEFNDTILIITESTKVQVNSHRRPARPAKGLPIQEAIHQYMAVFHFYQLDFLVVLTIHGRSDVRACDAIGRAISHDRRNVPIRAMRHCASMAPARASGHAGFSCPRPSVENATCTCTCSA